LGSESAPLPKQQRASATRRAAEAIAGKPYSQAVAEKRASRREEWTEEDFELSARRGNAALASFGAINFRSFREFDLDLGRLTVLAGPNGAGKSSIVDVPRFISDALSLSLYTALERRGGVKTVRHRSPTRPRNLSVHAGLSFGEGYGATYAIKLQSTAGGDYAIADEDCQTFVGKKKTARLHIKNGEILDLPPGPRGALLGIPEEIDKKTLGLPLFGGLPQLSPVLELLRDMRAYSIVPDKLRELQDPDEGYKLKSDGSNAASVLRRLESDARKELVEMLSYVVPGVTGVKTATRGNKLTMQFTQGSGKHSMSFDALQVSDGTLRLLGLLLALYQQRDPGFLAIEEPESTIHVAALQALVEVFRARSQHTQILLTTHSSEILDSLDLSELHLVDREGGISTLDSVSGDAKSAIEQALFSPGELLRTGSLSAAQ
jgi:predicted ATPase